MSRRETLWDYSHRHNLLAPGRAVLVGVSGGPDSLCLLDQLHALAGAHAFPLAVAHFDHSLRPESADEAAFVRVEAEARGRPFFTETADTAAFAVENGLSIEAAARTLRYAFLARAARQAGADYVAVAHTADDQAETVLMHFLRGSGLAGLRGMRPRSDMAGMVPGEGVTAEGRPLRASPLTLIRPLLATTRQAVEAYCAEHGLMPRHDPSNADLAYTRNRLRHVILPALERENPNLRATLARTAEVLAGEYDLAERFVDGAWGRFAPADAQRPGEVVFEREVGRQLGRLGLRALLRRGAAKLLGNARDLDFEPLDAATDFAMEAAPGRNCDIARGLRLAVETNRLVLYRGERDVSEYPLLLDAGGRLPAAWRLVAEDVETSSVADGLWQAIVPTAALTRPLTVRARRRGERFVPEGMGGHSVKLTDYMINVKLPAAVRDRWPVVACGDEVMWLPGYRLAERFGFRPDAKSFTRLWFVPAEAEAA